MNDLRPTTSAQFPDTDWSIVSSRRDANGDLDGEALEQLCRAYLSPLYAYFRVTIRLSQHDAEDLSIEFVSQFRTRVRQFPTRPDTPDGRFRNFLRHCARNFVRNRFKSAAAQKRGGGLPALCFEEIEELIAESGPADAVFDREWAATVVSQSRALLRDEYLRRGEDAEHDALVPFLIATPPNGAHGEIAHRLGITVEASRKRLERLRRRFQNHLRALVGATLRDPAEIDDELRHLMHAWLAHKSP